MTKLEQTLQEDIRLLTEEIEHLREDVNRCEAEKERAVEAERERIISLLLKNFGTFEKDKRSNPFWLTGYRVAITDIQTLTPTTPDKQ